jgi:excisionase family DNA binding protein
MTEKEMCEKLKVERIFLYHLRKKGLPFIRLGSKILRYEVTEVENWMKRNRKGESVSHD